ncbi:MAG: serine aminopeptidase domain-containing protein [Phycisphaerae bacterium]
MVLFGAAGCRAPAALRTPERYKNGVVFVLPGIEGTSPWNRNIAIGLDKGGVVSAIEVYDWTYKIPGANIFNLTNIERNREQAAKLAQRIIQHVDRNPGTPVHLIGHSGGGGMAVLTLEALPADIEVDQVVLLAPALSPEYDLSRALRRTRKGIVNYYSQLDLGFLGIGTTVFGSIDRDRGPSAGAIGFEYPQRLSADGRKLYASKLRQVRWTPQMAKRGAFGTHMGWMRQDFARSTLSPIIRKNESERRIARDAPASAPATSSSSAQ